MTAKRLVCLAAAATILLAGVEPVHAATTNAVIPYKALDEFFQMAGGVDQSRLLVRMFITSSNETVRPADVTLTIQSAVKGEIPVKLGTNGQVLSLPQQKELRRENPPVVANQPKGTLRMAVSIELPPPEGLAFRYSRLEGGVAETNKMIKEKAGLMSLLAPKAKGVIFIFPKERAGKAKVTIAAAAGNKEFLADQEGQVQLKLEKSLRAENPEVQLSEKPQAMVPDIE